MANPDAVDGSDEKKGGSPAEEKGKTTPDAGDADHKEGSPDEAKKKISERTFVIPKRCLAAMLIASGVGGLMTVVLFPLVLAGVGFGAAGVTAGSLAALWQSTMGGTVAAGSLFSILQSVGAVGISGAAAMTVTGATGGAAFAFCAALDKMLGVGQC